MKKRIISCILAVAVSCGFMCMLIGPDFIYSISLDDLLKGDEKMIEYLEESTNVVKSNKK